MFSGREPRQASTPLRAASVVELLAVIAIIAMLLAMLLPNLQQAKQQVRKVLCQSNLRQWSAASDFYRRDWREYLPTEGHGGKLGNEWGYDVADAWYNVLPPYLNAPSYRDVEGVGKHIKDFPELDVWICPAKNQTPAFKSGSGKNLYHYGMNAVLDGMGTPDKPSKDTPDFPDQEKPIRADKFREPSRTVYMFDIAWNSPAGSPRDLATEYQRMSDGGRVGIFHGDLANILMLDGAVLSVNTADLVTGRDFRKGAIVWEHPLLYWGYKPKRPSTP